ncbi:hypothetical protein SLA2020_373990 [Shorea laevis]
MLNPLAYGMEPYLSLVGASNLNVQVLLLQVLLSLAVVDLRSKNSWQSQTLVILISACGQNGSQEMIPSSMTLPGIRTKSSSLFKQSLSFGLKESPSTLASAPALVIVVSFSLLSASEV